MSDRPIVSSYVVISVLTALLFSCTTPSILVEQKNEVRQRVMSHNIDLSDDVIEYFIEIAFGSEYSGGNRLVTWNKPVKIGIMGDYTPEDLVTVRTVISELNDLLTSTTVKLVDNKPNITLRFTNQTGFDKYAPEYARKNNGYFYINWRGKENYVRKGRILIRSEGISQKFRNSVIREEITQILGIMRDSELHEESIFYQHYTNINYYSAIDKQVIKLWDALKPVSGSTQKEVRKLLEDLQKDI